jgi:hypothetical protein
VIKEQKAYMVKRVCDTGKEQKQKQQSQPFLRTKKLNYVSFTKFEKEDELPSYGESLCIRGRQCFKLNGNQTENHRYWQKLFFSFFLNCL